MAVVSPEMGPPHTHSPTFAMQKRKDLHALANKTLSKLRAATLGRDIAPGSAGRAGHLLERRFVQCGNTSEGALDEETGQLLRGKEGKRANTLKLLANWSGVNNGQTSTKLFGGNVVPHQGRCDKGCVLPSQSTFAGTFWPDSFEALLTRFHYNFSSTGPAFARLNRTVMGKDMAGIQHVFQ